MKRIALVFAGLFLLYGTSLALEKEQVEAILRTGVKAMAPSPVNGIIEVVTEDNRVVYLDESARYLFVGNLLDMEERVNLTQNRVDELTTVDFATLPLEDAVVEGDGAVKIAVFDDPDCPYCRRLHGELKQVKNVQYYYFLFNLPMHPKAYDKSKKILCSNDKLDALNRAMAGDELEDLPLCETDVVDRNKELSSRLGVRGTPHMILQSGKAIRGFKEAAELQKIVDEQVAEMAAVEKTRENAGDKGAEVLSGEAEGVEPETKTE